MWTDNSDYDVTLFDVLEDTDAALSTIHFGRDRIACGNALQEVVLDALQRQRRGHSQPRVERPTSTIELPTANGAIAHTHYTIGVIQKLG